MVYGSLESGSDTVKNSVEWPEKSENLKTKAKFHSVFPHKRNQMLFHSVSVFWLNTEIICCFWELNFYFVPASQQSFFDSVMMFVIGASPFSGHHH